MTIPHRVKMGEIIASSLEMQGAPADLNEKKCWCGKISKVLYGWWMTMIPSPSVQSQSLWRRWSSDGGGRTPRCIDAGWYEELMAAAKFCCKMGCPPPSFMLNRTSRSNVLCKGDAIKKRILTKEIEIWKMSAVPVFDADNQKWRSVKRPWNACC